MFRKGVRSELSLKDSPMALRSRLYCQLLRVDREQGQRSHITTHEQSMGKGHQPSHQICCLLQAPLCIAKEDERLELLSFNRYNFGSTVFKVSHLGCKKNRMFCLSVRLIWNDSQYRPVCVCLRTCNNRGCFLSPLHRGFRVHQQVNESELWLQKQGLQ